jgi:hypothetical protein
MTDDSQAGQPEESTKVADLPDDDDTLLQLVREEREKFTRRDTKLLHILIDELIKRGVYPAQSKTGNSIYAMVDGWGAYWHIWNSPLNCPSCNADLRDHEHGPPGKREIAIYDRMLDRTVAFRCPDCGHEWSRYECQKEEEAQERATIPDIPKRSSPVSAKSSRGGKGKGKKKPSKKKELAKR